jgi:tetratricopeptide (TPR) repeat protein
MAFLNRLKWVSAGLMVAGAITTAAVWGDPSPARPAAPAAPAKKLFSDEVVGRFTHKPAVAYQMQDGSVYFALQVKPELPAAPAKPRDIQILIDHSASQAGSSLEAARKIAREVISTAGESDRVSIWAVSTPKATRNLIRGGGLKAPADARASFGLLDNEYASGAVDLKDAVERVAKEFEGKTTRQQVILYLGDGESALNPLDEASRFKLANDLHSQNIAFYAVPLGTPMNAHNLHTLVSGTGGSVFRVADEASADGPTVVKALAARFHKSLGVSVLNPSKSSLASEAAEFYPAKLPPLRADVPTLVVGRFEKGKVPASIELTIEGKVSGTPVATKVTQAMPSPSADNFFLNSVVSQWRNSGRVDSPAMLRADRTLALAYESTRLAREEFIEQANWAVGARKFDTAKSLFDAAAKIDPQDPRAKGGALVIDKLNKGEISLEELRKVSFNTQDGPRVDVDQLVQEDPKKEQPKAPPVLPKDPGPAPADPNALLRQAEAQQRIREQQATVAVEETLGRARGLLNSGDPRSSKDLLIAQRDTVRVAGDIGEATRTKLLNRLELLLQDVVEKGDAMIRQRAEENERIARARQRLIAADQSEAREERIRERIRNFGTLMNQARYEDAYREALVMENEALTAGQVSPGATFAVARIGQAASNYRDFRELVRLREDRFLLAMMEVEKSHMPYPDEPSVHFPPAKVWRELTTRRREYSGTDFDKNMSPRQKQRYQFLQNSLLQTLDLRELKGGGDFAFGSLLTDIQRLVSNRMKRDVTIYINYSTFPQEARAILRDAKVNLNSLMDATGENLLREITFKTLLETLCRQAGASFWVTPDYIEIVEIEKAATSRVFKVLPVEDLIVPVPNAVNQLALQQQLQVLGQQFSLAGGNAFGALGAFGGNFGGNQNQNQGQGQAGGFNGQAGQLFQGGQPGGGALGFGGGNVGQLGNLGGQFGFQGGRQSVDPATELVVLIQTVVDPGFWDPDVSFLSKNLLTGQNRDDPAADGGQVEASLRNKMMYNLTTRSLVLFGRSRFHRSTPGRPLKKDEVAGIERANPEDRQIVKIGDEKQPGLGNGAARVNAKPKNAVDAERLWKQAIDKGIMDPGRVIACADYLVECREFKTAAELLKASLRSGVTPERWFQEALAIALEESQGSSEEIERAYLSAIDLEPKNPQTYLSVGRSLNALGNPDAATRLCKVAAKLEPNVSDAYANALTYGENPKATASYDVSAFAAGGLLSRDWASEGEQLHANARKHLLETVKKLDASNRKAEAEKVQAMLDADKVRDLVIEMSWHGKNSLLELRVQEPVGTVCSSVSPMTTGGGALRELSYDAKDDVYTQTYSASQAFSGTYKVNVDPIAIRSLQGDKVQIKVTRAKGTANERVDFHTVNIKEQTELPVVVEDGKRKDLAVLPSPVDMTKYRNKANEAGHVAVMNKLRALVSGTGSVGMGGGVGATGSQPASRPQDNRHGDVTWSTRLGAERSVGLDIRSETTVRTDGKVEVKATPVFAAVSKDARVKIDLIPGGE